MSGHTTVLAGPSGVGKSSIINALRADTFDEQQLARLAAFQRKMEEEYEWTNDVDDRESVNEDIEAVQEAPAPKSGFVSPSKCAVGDEAERTADSLHNNAPGDAAQRGAAPRLCVVRAAASSMLAICSLAHGWYAVYVRTDGPYISLAICTHIGPDNPHDASAALASDCFQANLPWW
jgi:hypothetical protein